MGTHVKNTRRRKDLHPHTLDRTLMRGEERKEGATRITIIDGKCVSLNQPPMHVHKHECH